MTQEEHDRLMHEFIGYLKRSEVTEYGIEHPIRLAEKNLGSVDVIVWAWDHVIIFDVKSDSKDLSNDIQKMRKYAYALSDTPGYRGTTIHMVLVYDAKQ